MRAGKACAWRSVGGSFGGVVSIGRTPKRVVRMYIRAYLRKIRKIGVLRYEDRTPMVKRDRISTMYWLWRRDVVEKCQGWRASELVRVKEVERVALPPPVEIRPGTMISEYQAYKYLEISRHRLRSLVRAGRILQRKLWGEIRFDSGQLLRLKAELDAER